jgi:ABC-type transport system involved in multi-copper enzyme maturation permease subunit
MLAALLRKEILNNLLNLRFTLSYFLCTVLLVGSASIMLADYTAQKKVYDTNRNIYQRIIDNNQGTYWDLAYLQLEKPIARPPVATKILAAGVEKDPDPKASVIYPLNSYFVGDFKRNPLTNLFPTMDAMFIIGIILSLLIFVLTYDSIAGEREEGTLKVLLSCPLPRDVIIMAKWLGGFVSLIVPYLIAWLIVGLIIVFSPGLSFGAEEWTRLFLVVFIGAVYVAVIFSISMAVSVVARQSGIAILSLLFIWVVFIVGIPALSTPAAYLALKPPTVEQTRLDIDLAGYPAWAERGAQVDSFIAKLLNGRKQEELTQEEMMEIGNKFGYTSWHLGLIDSMNGIGKKLSRVELNIDRLSRSFARFSPFGCFQNMCVNLAGTGISRELDLRTSIENFYHNDAAEYFGYLERSGHNFLDYRGAMAPRFKAISAPIRTAVSQSLPDLATLICVGILAFMIAFLGFLRMDII